MKLKEVNGELGLFGQHERDEWEGHTLDLSFLAPSDQRTAPYVATNTSSVAFKFSDNEKMIDDVYIRADNTIFAYVNNVGRYTVYSSLRNDIILPEWMKYKVRQLRRKAGMTEAVSQAGLGMFGWPELPDTIDFSSVKPADVKFFHDDYVSPERIAKSTISCNIRIRPSPDAPIQGYGHDKSIIEFPATGQLNITVMIDRIDLNYDKEGREISRWIRYIYKDSQMNGRISGQNINIILPQWMEDNTRRIMHKIIQQRKMTEAHVQGSLGLKIRSSSDLSVSGAKTGVDTVDLSSAVPEMLIDVNPMYSSSWNKNIVGMREIGVKFRAGNALNADTLFINTDGADIAYMVLFMDDGATFNSDETNIIIPPWMAYKAKAKARKVNMEIFLRFHA